MKLFEDNNENKVFKELKCNEKLENNAFYKCTFSNSSFQSSQFVGCDFDNCEFINCDLSLIEIPGAVFSDAKFIDCKLLGINWSSAGGFFSASFKGCLLNNNAFADMNLSKFKFESCSLVEALFSNAKMAYAVFDDCDLDGCQFHQADLSFADFSTSRNYYINASTNTLHKTVFSVPEAVSLLKNLDIVLK
jgi:uncharacterized protein YjbI with pentapeptide repeats